MLEAALEFSRKMVEARMKPKPIINRENEEIIIAQIKLAGEVFGIQQTIKKIKNHGK